MRKLFASAFAIVLVLTAAIAPVGAEQVDLTDFICQTYGFNTGDFIVADSYEVNLEYLGLRLTVQTWLTEGPEYRKGQVGWVAETNEYLVDDELNNLFSQERELVVKEYQELQKLAGKMDVSLYKALTSGASDELHEIWITPVHRLISDLEDQIRALYQQFNLEPPKDISEGYGRTPAIPEDGGAGSSGSEGSIDPAPPQLTPLPSPLPAYDYDTVAPYDPDAPVSNETDRDIYQPYPEEFIIALNAIYAQAYADSIATLTAHLDQLGISYETGPGHVVATVTATQALDLRDREDVEWIGGYYKWIEEDFAPTMGDAAFLANDDKNIARAAGDLTEAAPVNNGSWVWAGGLVGFMALGVFLILKK